MLNSVFVATISVTMLFFIIWVIHLALKNAAIVDIGWGLGFILITSIYVLRGEGFNLRNIILLVLISLWGLRIAWFLVKRISFEKKEDRRYQELRDKWGPNIEMKFLLLFEFQAFLQIFISTPILLVAMNPEEAMSVFEMVGCLCFLTALIGEMIADEQLQAFKENPINKGKVCQIGLWQYSRHPNYFFEFLCWVGIYIFSLGSPYGWITIVSPLIMLHLVYNVSGIPLAEAQSLKSRGEEYRAYQKSTSKFIPLPRIQ